ncbi:MAG: DMT family transporter [Pseudomonadota bacterium]
MSQSHSPDTDAPDERPFVGIAFLLAATTIFPLQDVIIKFLSDAYAVHQVVFIRSLFALPLVVIIARFEGQFLPLRIGHWGLQITRSVAAFFSYTCYYLALSSIGLAEAVAIAFSTPIFVTLLATLFLNEKVGMFRVLAIFLGLAGVLVIVQPGMGVFQPAAIFALLAAVFYAFSIMATRKLGRRTNGTTMTVITVVTYIIGGGLVGAVFAIAPMDSPHASLDFLFREWVWPAPGDWVLLVVIGGTAAAGFFCLAQAYRLAEASVVTPFEYTAMPWAVLWGWIFFSELPDTATWIGLSMIISAGLLIVFRETVQNRRLVLRKGLGVFRQR